MSLTTTPLLAAFPRVMATWNPTAMSSSSSLWASSSLSNCTHSRFKSPATTGPKTLKLFINQPRTLGFDQALGMEPVQLLELSANDLDEGAVIPLRYVKFQNVQNLQIFVKDNQSGSETTRINYLVVYGSPINTTNMGEFKRVAGKKGESH
uniref:Putative thioredoxin-like protein n=1 Tax=Ixodes ricinus TaxID=34613 RepID=V5IBM9_IXORI